jgi:superoxide dismutase, Fe-Mn family
MQTPSTMTPAMELALVSNFGSKEAWLAAFLSTAATATQPGSVLLVFQAHTGMLVNQWAPTASPANSGEVVLLALGRDAFTAAAVGDQDAFMENIPWDQVYERYQIAVHDATESLGAGHADVAGVLLLDVRRAAVFEKAPTKLVGSRWSNPATVGLWARDLPAAKDIVVYCVYGHEVSRITALRLQAVGLTARYLVGGIDAWQAAGLIVEPKPLAA